MKQVPMTSQADDKNHTLLILANGPSVSDIDLHKLFHEYRNICVLNAAIYHLKEFPSPPKFCFINDSSLCKKTIIQELIQNEKLTKIIPTANCCKEGVKVKMGKGGYTDILSCCIKYFCKKDFKKIVIFGLDFNYDSTQNKEFEAGVKTNDNSKHYTINDKPLYNNSDWVFPNLSLKIKSMKLAKNNADKNNVEIHNATKNSSCDIFDLKYSEYSEYYK